MIESIFIITSNEKKSIDFDAKNPFKTSIDFLNSEKYTSFDIEIVFSIPIVSFRNHDYTWVDVSENRMAPEFTSKIITLEDGTWVQPNWNIGIWELNPKNKRQLLWRFNPNNSNPLTEYTGTNNVKRIVPATNTVSFETNLELLFSKNNALEISRSKIPFSAIACFTDHCDYDTLENLKVQRKLFSDLAIKTTKGFFLNHFSKRANNASVENDKQEIEQWLNDGHELAYHSLSQSIKSTEESFEDFRSFQPPFDNIPVWIDHGFQPYNFSLYKNNSIQNDDFESVLMQKNIKVLWNYIDCGTATNGVINQLNNQHFTLQKFIKGNSHLGFIKTIQLTIKNIIFHFLTDEENVTDYKNVSVHFKNIVYKRKLGSVRKFLYYFIRILKPMLKTVFNWSKNKKTPYKFALYSPIFFNHTINNHQFVVFQTLDMVDFKSSLSQQNIDLLIDESGLFVAHTYFSVDMKHHHGKLFKHTNSLDEKVVQNFNYLSQKIKENKVWNPTLTELLHHLEEYKKTLFDIDEKGAIFTKNNFTIPSRNLQ